MLRSGLGWGNVTLFATWKLDECSDHIDHSWIFPLAFDGVPLKNALFSRTISTAVLNFMIMPAVDMRTLPLRVVFDSRFDDAFSLFFLFCDSVAEEEEKAKITAEAMEISTRSKGKNIQCSPAFCLCVVWSCKVVLFVFIWNVSWVTVSGVFLSLKVVHLTFSRVQFRTRGRQNGWARNGRCRVPRPRPTVTPRPTRRPAPRKRRRSRALLAAAKTRYRSPTERIHSADHSQPEGLIGFSIFTTTF